MKTFKSIYGQDLVSTATNTEYQYQNKIQDERLSIIEGKLDKIMENHLHGLPAIQSDIEWIKKFFWIIAGASIGGLISGILNLIIRK